HPIGRAIARAAADELGALPPVTGFRSRPGLGVTGVVDGHEIEVGRRDGRIDVSWDGVSRATLAVRDTVKPASETAGAALTARGLAPVLLTRDSRDLAEAVPA